MRAMPAVRVEKKDKWLPDDVTKNVGIKMTDEGEAIAVEMDVQPSREMRLIRKGDNLEVSVITTDYLYNPEGDVDWRVTIPLNLLKKILKE